MNKLSIFVLLLVEIVAPSYAAEEPQTFLRKYLHFSKDDESVIDRGEPVARILDPTHPTELSPFGVVRVRVTRDAFLEKLRNIAEFKKSREVLEIGKLHMPPLPQDFDALTFDPDEIDSLRKCTAGNCTLKLSADMIQRFRTEIDWDAPDHRNRVASLYRKMLFEYARDYLDRGNEVLIAYNDKKAPGRLAGEFRSLLESSPYLAEYAPDFLRYMTDFPRVRLEGGEDFIYWSKEKFGYKSVVSLTHVTIYRHPTTPYTFIASKQLYASHYFYGSLGLSLFCSGSPSAYLVYLNRSRVDLPGGMFSGLVRFFVKRRIVEGLDKYLKITKERLETVPSSQ